MAQPIAAALSAARSRRPASNTNAPDPTPRAPTARPSGLSKTSLREWVYARPYASSQERTLALMRWLDHYNNERPHTALAHRPPAARLRQSQLLGSIEQTVASSRPATTPVTLAQGGSYA